MDYTLQDPRTMGDSAVRSSSCCSARSRQQSTKLYGLYLQTLPFGFAKLYFQTGCVSASLNMEGIVATRRQTLSVMDAMRVQESVLPEPEKRKSSTR